MAHRTKRPTILVTGGAGYIGTHCVLTLLEQKYKVIVVDNCSNTYVRKVEGKIFPESLRRVEELVGLSLTDFYKLDLVEDDLDVIFQEYQIDAVIHFAAFKSVSESIEKPLAYYTNNVTGTLRLLNSMQKYGCHNLIFSSSATVYGLPQYLPVDEKHPTGVNLMNPYGRGKFMIEQILMDLCCHERRITEKDKNWNIISLRYFNPIGAHPSGYIGEYTKDLPNNLMPYLLQVVTGQIEKLYVYGNDYETIDGTGVRDYVHIMDIAEGHVKALEYLYMRDESIEKRKTSTFETFNLGTGKGYSVLELIKIFEKINHVKIPVEIVGRRSGDIGEVYADVQFAHNKLNWCAKRSVADMVRDGYRWQSSYPEGYE